MAVREEWAWGLLVESLRGGSGGGNEALPPSASREYGGGGDCEGDAMFTVVIILTVESSDHSACRILWNG